MNVTDFVQAVSESLNETHRLVLRDINPVAVVWSVGSEPDTIIVRTGEGDVFNVNVSRLGTVEP